MDTTDTDDTFNTGTSSCARCHSIVAIGRMDTHQRSKVCAHGTRIANLKAKGWMAFDRRATPLVAEMGLPYDTIWVPGVFNTRTQSSERGTPEAWGPSCISVVFGLVNDAFADQLWRRNQGKKTWQIRDELRRRAFRAVRANPDNLSVMLSLDALADDDFELIHFLKEFPAEPVCSPPRNDKGYCFDRAEYVPDPVGEKS